jgi:multidrug efflux pump
VAQGNIFFRTVPWEERKRTTQEMAREMTPRVAGLTGVSAFPITPPSLGQGFTQRPINYVIITSDSYQNLAQTVRQFQDELAKNPGFPGRHRSAPEQARDPLEVDRERAADNGVNVDAIARAVETMLGGRR